MNNIINELLKLNQKAIKKDEVPVSAIIVKNNNIIAKAYNTKNKSNNVMNHAEIIVIKKATKKLKTWILDDCNLYVTLEPCPMCKEIIKQSRIKNTYYFMKNNKIINYKTSFNYINNTYSKYFEKELKNYFKNKR